MVELRSKPLGGSSLVTEWLQGSSRVRPFYPVAPGDLAGYREVAGAVGRRFGGQDRERVAALLQGGGDDRRERLEAFVERDGFVVTTGQQPGLFGGPLYTLYKGFTVAALARRLEEALERPVLPVFWIASEDHDWDEARSTHVLDPENQVHEISLDSREGLPAPALHSLPLGDEVVRARDRLTALLPGTDFSERWLQVVTEAYAPGTTLPEAFQSLLESLLGDEGVFLVQSHDPGLKEASLPLLLTELDRVRQSEEELRERGRALEDEGFSLQVPLLEGATNLFLEGPRGRERLFVEGDDRFRLRRSGESVGRRELEDQVRNAPGALSPNVLLRPVVEGRVLPTLCYVAGPGEAAYLPQTEPLFRAHGVTRPVTHPRVSLSVMEGKVAKVLEKFSLELEDLDQPHHELVGRLIRDEIPEGIRQALGGLRGDVARGSGTLAREVAEVDPTLKGPVEHLRNQAFGLLDEVEKKVVQSLKREQEVTLAQIRKAQVNLFPLGRPQERVLSPFQYLVRYDREFVDQVGRRAREAVLP